MPGVMAWLAFARQELSQSWIIMAVNEPNQLTVT